MDMYLKYPIAAEELERSLVGRAMQLARKIVEEELVKAKEQSVADATIAARVALRLKKEMMG